MKCLRMQLAMWVLLGITSIGSASEGHPQSSGAQSSGADIVLVVGAPGSDEFKTKFELWSRRWKEYVEQSQSQLEIIGESSDQEAGDRDRLEDAIQRQVTGAKSPLLIVFIGHGTHLRGKSKFNLRGPDVTDEQLAAWLTDVKRPLVVIQCASSSAPFIRALSGTNRVIITATRSASEQNFSRFGDHFSAALSDSDADLDHDQAISLLEAFLLASHNVAEFYDQESRLATEHSLLDDNADQLGSSAEFFRGIRANKAAKDGAPLDGLRAHQIVLCWLPGHVPVDPELVAERDQLEQEIESLRQRKSGLPEDRYFEELEPLMIKLARLYDRSRVE